MEDSTRPTTKTVAEHLVETLERRGIQHVFGLCGHTNIAVLSALADSPIDFVTVRHEQIAAHGIGTEEMVSFERRRRIDGVVVEFGIAISGQCPEQRREYGEHRDDRQQHHARDRRLVAHQPRNGVVPERAALDFGRFFGELGAPGSQ